MSSAARVLPGLQADDLGDDAGQKDNLTAVMESMGIYDTDLRAHGNDGSAAINETQRLLKILLTTLKKAVSRSSLSSKPSGGPVSESESDLKQPKELASQTNYTEVGGRVVAAGTVEHACKQTLLFSLLGGHGL